MAGDPGAAGPARELAHALSAAGHTGAILCSGAQPPAPDGFEAIRLRALPGAPLRLRKIGDGLEVLPATLLALARGRFDAAQAFAPSDALAAIAWARRAGRPVVFTCVEPPRREALASRRLRLATWRRALAGSDAVLARTDDVRDALRRWLAVDAPVVASGDAEAHVALYRRGARRAADDYV